MTDAVNNTNYCYVSSQGDRSPTFHLFPGDEFVLTLINGVEADPNGGDTSTNIHLHGILARSYMYYTYSLTNDIVSTCCIYNNLKTGLFISPTGAQDNVIVISIDSGDMFKYYFKIPYDHPPGLYWYHPHVYGTSTTAVLGGASGGIIIENIEKQVPELIGMPTQVMLFRGNLPAPALQIDSMPTWDVSVNFVPILAPDFLPVTMTVPPLQKRFLRLGNLHSDLILNFQIVYDGVPQPFRLIAMDGVVVAHVNQVVTSLLVPAASRGEIIYTTPSMHVKAASLMTLNIDTGPLGDRDFQRTLVVFHPIRDDDDLMFSESIMLPASPVHGGNIIDSLSNKVIDSTMNTAIDLLTSKKDTGIISSKQHEDSSNEVEAISSRTGLRKQHIINDGTVYLPRPDLATMKPHAKRKIYFSEVVSDPSNPDSLTYFYVTLEGNTPKQFSPNDPPTIIATQGTVEEWTIENRSGEVHVFHIHQAHFIVTHRVGIPPSGEVPHDVNTVFYDNFMIPYYNGTGPYPSITARIDFSALDVGEFVYHCHILGEYARHLYYDIY